LAYAAFQLSYMIEECEQDSMGLMRQRLRVATYTHSMGVTESPHGPLLLHLEDRDSFD
jgi:hypothetical protein